MSFNNYLTYSVAAVIEHLASFAYKDEIIGISILIFGRSKIFVFVLPLQSQAGRSELIGLFRVAQSTFCHLFFRICFYIVSNVDHVVEAFIFFIILLLG